MLTGQQELKRRPHILRSALFFAVFMAWTSAPAGAADPYADPAPYGPLRRKMDAAAALAREGDRTRAEASYEEVWSELKESFPLEFCEPGDRGRIASLYVGVAMARASLRAVQSDVEGVFQIYQEAIGYVPENAGLFYDAMARSVVGQSGRDKIVERLKSDEALGLDAAAREHVLGRVYAILGDTVNARSYLQQARASAMDDGAAQLLAETDRWIESLP